MNKKIYCLLCFFLISNCALPSSAFLGPVYTGVKTGSIYQTSLSYSSSKIVNNLVVKNSTNQLNINNNLVKNPILPDIPYIDIDPKILVKYEVDYVEISSVIEPEPLP